MRVPDRRTRGRGAASQGRAGNTTAQVALSGSEQPRLSHARVRQPIQQSALHARPQKEGLRPFTVKHFRQWARRLELDNGNQWETEPFQEAFLEDLFADIPECWLIVPEGNAKTTLLAGVGLYHIQHRRSAMVPIGASSRDQAEILYRQAEGFIERSDIRGFKCLPGYRRIRYDETLSRIQIFAADDRTGDGIIPTLALVDELHRHRDLRLYRTWRGKIEKRQGQIAAISTRGEPGSEFELTLERIRQEATDLRMEDTFVRAASSRLVLHEWSVPEGGDVEDLDLVKRANPLKAITVPRLAEKRATPTMTLNHWRRFVCNLPTRSDAAAITEAEWYDAKVDDGIPEGQPIYLGLDVAWKWDTTAAVPLWFRDDAYRLLGPASVLVPPRDGNSLDPESVEEAIRHIHARNPIHTVVMDTSRAEQLGRWIETAIGAVVIDRQQTNSLAVEDYDRFMEALRSGWLKHTGDADLTKHALNAIARVLPFGDARFDRPSQSRSGPEQERRVIDALIAAAMAHSVASQPAEQTYEPNFAWA
jgi:phage terminase large subunit-like protein